MSRYIDADRAIESLFDYCNGKKTIGQCIDDTPTEEVNPIVYGKWININGIKSCNQCGIGISSPYDNFCPNCGSRMREVEK